MMKPAKEYENAKKINGNDASETKFDNIKNAMQSYPDPSVTFYNYCNKH